MILDTEGHQPGFDVVVSSFAGPDFLGGAGGEDLSVGQDGLIVREVECPGGGAPEVFGSIGLVDGADVAGEEDSAGDEAGYGVGEGEDAAQATGGGLGEDKGGELGFPVGGDAVV